MRLPELSVCVDRESKSVLVTICPPDGSPPREGEDFSEEICPAGCVRLPGHVVIDEGTMLDSEKAAIRRRSPCDICCVIDVSGSMNDSANVSLSCCNDSRETSGLTILDFVKHSVRTLVKTLGARDRLGIVVFSRSARVVLELKPMGHFGRIEALEVLDTLRPESTTNIWAGLELGLDMLRSSANDSPNPGRQVMLFTDGRPNVLPPSGHMPTLREYKRRCGGDFTCSIQTFGFGNDIDSGLLREIALEGNGLYGFIPDASHIGSLFIHALTNLQTTMATGAVVRIRPLNGSSIGSCFGQLPRKTASDGTVSIEVGSLRFGQTRDVLLRMNSLPSSLLDAVVSVEMEFLLQVRTAPVTIRIEEAFVECNERQRELILENEMRLRLVDMMHSATQAASEGRLDVARELVASFHETVLLQNLQDHPVVGEYLKDLVQISRALKDPSTFARWGNHYLPSLMCAHLYQQCHTFSDPGVQNFGGGLFRKLRDAAEKVFMDLPPPTPSRRKKKKDRGVPSWRMKIASQARREPSAPMRTGTRVYNARAGCIAGWSRVKMGNGCWKFVRDLQKGDVVVANAGGETATVKCVVRTDSGKEGVFDFVEFPNGLCITPWHPIRMRDSSKWQFPCSVGEVQKDIRCDAVYNFVLESRHTMLVDGIECVCLGHGFSEDVVRHEYLGTKRIVKDLEGFEGWDAGLVGLHSTSFLRSKVTRLIVGLQHSSEILSSLSS